MHFKIHSLLYLFTRWTVFTPQASISLIELWMNMNRSTTGNTAPVC